MACQQSVGVGGGTGNQTHSTSTTIKGIVMPINFTISSINQAMQAASPEKTTVIRDSKTTGLILRGRQGGNWTWALEKRINEKLCRSVLGRWEETRDIESMRAAAADIAAAFRRGEDPRKPDQDALVLEAMKITAEDWRVKWSKSVRERTAKDAANDLRYLGLTSKPLLQLTKNDIQAAYDLRLKTVCMVTVAKEMRTVRLLWNVAAKTLPDSVVLKNPVSATLGGGRGNKNKLLPKVRRTTFVPLALMPDFIADLRKQQSLAGVGSNVRALAAEFLCLTGLRAKEVNDLRWCEVSIKALEFTIPAERSKNGNPVTRGITQRLLEIIKTRINQRGKNDEFVFQSASKKGVSIFDCAAPIKDAAQSVGFEHRTQHDMRRTYISAATELGVSPIISRLLTNHLSGADVHDGYTQTTIEQIRSAERLIEAALIGGGK